MTELDYNPYAQERDLRWRNRIADWHAQSDETAFHLFALSILAALLSWLIWQNSPRLIAAVDVLVSAWPMASALAALLSLTEVHAAALRRQNLRWSQHWLVAQPIADSLRRRILLQQSCWRVIVQAAVGVVLLWLAEATWKASLSWVGIVLAAALIGWRRAHRAARSGAQNARREAVIAPRGRGSFWTWQWTEAAASLAPYRVSRLIWLVLLVPRGQWIEIGLALLLVACGIVAVAWTRSIAVMPAAERWLALQPLRPVDLLWRCAAFPALLLGSAVSALIVLLMLSGQARWSIAIAATIFLPATLHWVSAAAERRRPVRIGIQLTFHLILLAATLQALPMLLLPVWIAQLIWLLHKALRP